jgi:uncharacterized membrane protein
MQVLRNIDNDLEEFYCYAICRRNYIIGVLIITLLINNLIGTPHSPSFLFLEVISAYLYLTVSLFSLLVRRSYVLAQHNYYVYVRYI